MFLAAANVYMRDVQHLVEVGLMVGFWLTPIVYSWQMVAGAVSYTHLRAHETVLDLVCRLLLEKKNIQYSDVGRACTRT